MIELNNKYKIGVRRFGRINFKGFLTLVEAETRRWLIVLGQTLLGPAITAILFYLVIKIAFGTDRYSVLNVPYEQFLISGLCIMICVQQAFSHSSSSILMKKVMGTIYDLLTSPLSAFEVISAITIASAIRGIILVIFTLVIFSFFAEIEIYNYFYFFLALLLSSTIMGAAGVIAGIISEKFEHISNITSFIVTPLSFLSCSFYPITKLPETIQNITYHNPFFVMIDFFRFSVLGIQSGSLSYSIIYLTILAFITWFISFLLYKSGHKLKN